VKKKKKKKKKKEEEVSKGNVDVDNFKSIYNLQLFLEKYIN
jgi:hypothetical protein